MDKVMANWDVYFAILRDYLWGEAHVAKTDNLLSFMDDAQNVTLHWDVVMQMASLQGSLPLVADYALMMKSKPEPSPEQKMIMRQAAMQNILHQQKLRGYLKMVKDCLDSAGISFVLLKGYGLASFYPNPDVRSSGDIDIWVGEDRFYDACKALKTLPQVITYEDQVDCGVRHFNLHWENAKYVIEVHPRSYKFPSRGESVRYLEFEKRYMEDSEDKIRVESVGDIQIPTIRFNVLYIFLHIWNHYLHEGVQWKQLVDWALVLKNFGYAKSEDTNPFLLYLKNDLNYYHLMEAWQSFMYLLVNRLGLPPSLALFYSDGTAISRTASKVEYDIWMGNARIYLQEKVYGGKGLKHKISTIRFLWLDYQSTRSVFSNYAKHTLQESIKSALLKNIGL